MSTTPKAAQLEQSSGLAPLARQWIKALVSEVQPQQTVAPASNQEQINKLASELYDVLNRINKLTERVEELETRYDVDERYSITRGKVVALMKKMGI